MISLKDKKEEFNCDLNTPCFQQLPSKAIELIKNSKTKVLFRKGDNLCKQGTFSSYILFVVSGLAIQYLESKSGKNLNLRVIRSSEFIGLHSIFSSKTYDYSTVAIADCQVILVEKEPLQQIMLDYADFTMKLISRYSQQNTLLFEIISKLQFKQMNGRFADVLLYLESLNVENIFTLLSRKQLAEFAGISTESAVKILKSLEKSDIIYLENKDIIIKDKKALLQLSKFG